MTTEGGVQYSKIAEIKGPLVVVDDVENAAFDELVEVETNEGERLIDSPVCVVGGDAMGGPSARRMMKMMQGDDSSLPAPSVKLQINLRHAIIRGLSELRDSNADTASLVAHQLLDNALASADLLEDPREMISRSFQALEKLTAT